MRVKIPPITTPSDDAELVNTLMGPILLGVFLFLVLPAGLLALSDDNVSEQQFVLICSAIALVGVGVLWSAIHFFNLQTQKYRVPQAEVIGRGCQWCKRCYNSTPARSSASSLRQFRQRLIRALRLPSNFTAHDLGTHVGDGQLLADDGLDGCRRLWVQSPGGADAAAPPPPRRPRGGGGALPAHRMEAARRERQLRMFRQTVVLK